MIVDGEKVRFDNVFSELHTESYKGILAGDGYGIDDSYNAIQVVQKIRESV
jgi:UDP-N-acetyl-2-amino-2-deoxyglucuronate dehydrogenase